jgi:hypothetical protein
LFPLASAAAIDPLASASFHQANGLREDSTKSYIVEPVVIEATAGWDTLIIPPPPPSPSRKMPEITALGPETYVTVRVKTSPNEATIGQHVQRPFSKLPAAKVAVAEEAPTASFRFCALAAGSQSKL